MEEIYNKKFCEQTGKLHSSNSLFCSDCGIKLQPITPIPKAKRQEVIETDDSPEVQSKAIHISSQVQKGPIRTVAEIARQPSSYRTGSTRGAVGVAKLPILLIFSLVRYEIIEEDGIKISKLINSYTIG
jgi:hypothetical protein